MSNRQDNFRAWTYFAGALCPFQIRRSRIQTTSWSWLWCAEGGGKRRLQQRCEMICGMQATNEVWKSIRWRYQKALYYSFKNKSCFKPLWPSRLVPWQCMRDFILRMHAVTLGTQRWVLVCYDRRLQLVYRVPLWRLRRDHFRRPGSFHRITTMPKCFEESLSHLSLGNLSTNKHKIAQWQPNRVTYHYLHNCLRIKRDGDKSNNYWIIRRPLAFWVFGSACQCSK